jgi:UDP-N-acetylmuramoylalanine--D-glutamate ligase
MSKNISNLAGKTVAIMGLDKSTLAIAQLLHANGVKIQLSELNPKDQVMELAKELSLLQPEVNAEYGKYSAATFEGAEFVLVSANVRLDTKPLDEAKARGLPILNDVELLSRDIDVPVVAFAGTEGKTTTAMLARAFLEAQGKKIFYSGDHGEPLANYLLKKEKADFVFLELSAPQLEGLQEFRPYIAVLTSLQPPFPERFPRLEDSANALRGLLRNLNDKSFIVYNFRDVNLKQLVAGNPAQKRVFRRKDPIALGYDIARLYKGSFLLNSRELVWLESEQKTNFSLRHFKLFGLHNKDNAMAALNVAKILGVSNENIQKVLDHFASVPHRLEFVKKKGGVRFVNDSRTVTVDALRKSLESFPLDPIILVAGGRDAQGDFTSLADLVKSKVKTMILVGEAKEHINRCVGDYTETFLVGTFEEAVLLSYQKSREGDIILLSPGCESYDMFVSYEERGNYFKKYVEEL